MGGTEGNELNLEDRTSRWSQSVGSYDFLQQYLSSEGLVHSVVTRWGDWLGILRIIHVAKVSNSSENMVERIGMGWFHTG